MPSSRYDLTRPLSRTGAVRGPRHGGDPGSRAAARSVVEAEAAQLLRVALPVLGDLDPQVEVDPGAEERLDLPPRLAAHFLQPGALGADDDGLLARPFHVHQGVHVDQVAAALARR